LNDEEPSAYRGPRVELFVIPDCPYATLAETLLRSTLNELGLSGVPVRTTVIATSAEAIRRGFMGSPSIEINGIDPWAQPDGAPALACRLYPSSTGLPTQHSLARALCSAVLDDRRLPRQPG
jgi:glutaredoxin